MWRRVILENRIPGGVLCMKESQYAAMEDRYGHQIKLPPGGVRGDVSASIFRSRNHHACRPSKIVLFVNETKYERALTPDTFVHYAKLIFELDAYNLLRVYGVRGRLSDLSRLWVFGFLGRDYRGRQEELILTSIASQE